MPELLMISKMSQGEARRGPDRSLDLGAWICLAPRGSYLPTGQATACSLLCLWLLVLPSVWRYRWELAGRRNYRLHAAGCFRLVWTVCFPHDFTTMLGSAFCSPSWLQTLDHTPAQERGQTHSSAVTFLSMHQLAHS